MERQLSGSNSNIRRHIRPRRGRRLGSVGATWERLKLVGAPEEAESPNRSGNSNRATPITENGPQGDIVMVFPDSNYLEIWSLQTLVEGEPVDCETIYLMSQHRISLDASSLIESFKVLDKSGDNEYRILLLTKTAGDEVCYNIEVHAILPLIISGQSMLGRSRQEEYYSELLQKIELPYVMQENKKGHIVMKANRKFITVADDQGFIFFYKWDDSLKSFRAANFDRSLALIRKKSCEPILNRLQVNSNVSEDNVLMRTSCVDRTPIFDIVGDWLVYCPTRQEYQHLRAVNVTNKWGFAKTVEGDPLETNNMNNEESPRKSIFFTPVKLPRNGPLLNRVFSSLSNSAADGLLKISETSSNKMRGYFSKETNHAEATNNKDVMQSLNSIGKGLGKLLYSTASSTASSIQKGTLATKVDSNQLISVLDLANDKIMAIFKPPMGVSNVSLSPYDLQLVSSNIRGDTFYLWDLYKLPSEISLLGKFPRGKTSAVAKDIKWFIERNNGGIVQGHNSGFGYITKQAGSVHWVNINYLANDLSSNYPIKSKSCDTEDISPFKMKALFLDSWVLPSLNATKFLTLAPENSMYSENSPVHLAILDKDNHLKPVSPLDGTLLCSYELPSGHTSSSAYRQLHYSEQKRKEGNKRKRDIVAPLAQAEIETCKPYFNIVNNKNVLISTYAFKDDSSNDHTNLINLYREMGPSVPESHFHIDEVEKYHNSVHNLVDLTRGLEIEQADDLMATSGL